VAPLIPRATDSFNRQLLDRIERLVCDRVPRGSVVAVLGVSYKPGSNIVEESQGADLALRLAARGYSVIAYDPVAEVVTPGPLAGTIKSSHDLATAFADADAVVLANADPALSGLSAGDFANRPLLVIDCWRQHLSAFEGTAKVEYVGLGRFESGRVGNNRLHELVSALAGEVRLSSMRTRVGHS
jgi:UDPglucose 6-dehydrogenase